jgi:hypothetical protein
MQHTLISGAAESGHVQIVDVLLNDERVNPGLNNYQLTLEMHCLAGNVPAAQEVRCSLLIEYLV